MTTPPTQPEPDPIAPATYALACVLHGHTTTSAVDAADGDGPASTRTPPTRSTPTWTSRPGSPSPRPCSS